MTEGILGGLGLGREKGKSTSKAIVMKEKKPGELPKIIIPTQVSAQPSPPGRKPTVSELRTQLLQQVETSKHIEHPRHTDGLEQPTILHGFERGRSLDPADRLSDLGRELEKLSRFNPFAILKRKALQTEMEVLQQQVEAEESPLLGEKPERIEILQSQIPIVPPIDIEKIIIKPKTPEPEKARGGVEIEEPAWVIKQRRIEEINRELAQLERLGH